MRTVELSDTNVFVSCLGLGTLRFGTLNSYAESAELLDMYLEAGGRFLDTANCYNQWAANAKGGESEVVLGQWLRERGNRDELFIASKVGFGYGTVPDGLAAKTIISACEESLRRLGTDHIDLYYAHKDDPNTPLEETLSAFTQLKESGKIRFAGASNYLAWRLADADAIAAQKGLAEFTCIEQRFTYLRPQPGSYFFPQRLIDENLATYCDARGKTMLPYTPLLRGAYVRTDRPIAQAYQGPDTDARMAALKEVSQAVGATPNQVVLAWMMQRQPPLIPIFSAGQPAHMQENLGALDITLIDDQMTKLTMAGHCPNEEPN
ncbi:aldo/keto reductase [Nodosilinea sp. P-1105]|uniref:aldo/keto reductase n=1 Tax=Nodosilinea sp. P-1105 TaxID=2546229 RepID=UPI00146E3A50|nr:aldo/keto reductase [Nodosilinea sp. P-1105]NMF86483.1 aldo/keto reductase [Nodosilinea sp. P-1105]